jgi:hypothetical protein
LSKQFGQQICDCIQTINFRLRNRCRSLQVTFDTNQLEQGDEEEEEKKELDSQRL